MKQFNILSKNLDFDKSHALEASAGTGKTYSIEHLVSRLLLEKKDKSSPYQLSEIVIVTFTRAATRELKTRIYDTIRANIDSLLGNGSPTLEYLKACSTKESLFYLKRALASFDEANIYTIHSFCASILKEFSDCNSLPIEEDTFRQSIAHAVKNYLYTEDVKKICTPSQLEILLQTKKDILSELIKFASSSKKIKPSLSIQKQFALFCKEIESLNLAPQKVLEDFIQLAPYYKPLGGKEVLSYLPQVERFIELFSESRDRFTLFDLMIKDSIVLSTLLSPSNLYKRKTVSYTPHYPELVEKLSTLYKIVEYAREPAHIFSLAAHECQKFIKNYIERERLVGPDQLLTLTAQAAKDPLFCKKVAERYRFAIVDEFQDTDPIQWQILHSFFVKQNVHIALVGDPKQAIYSFRQADIQTYFTAIDSLPDSAKSSLTTNYRSTPQLIKAINTLFDEKNTPALFSKPYVALNASQEAGSQEKAMHFFVDHGPWKQAEKRIILKIAQEIKQLCKPYREFAILVRDRRQAAVVEEIFKKNHIPLFIERAATLTDSLACQTLLQLLQATLNPHDRSIALQCFGGPLFNLTLEESDSFFEKSPFLSLQEVLYSKGIMAFFQTLMLSQLEGIVAREGGVELYRDLLQVVEILANEELKLHLAPLGLIHHLQNLQSSEHEIRVKEDGCKDAVRVMTIHISKGLEFSSVFALGLIARSKNRDLLIYAKQIDRLIASAEKESIFSHYKLLDEEKARLAYVAITRAKEQVYIPVIYDTKKPEIGCASAIELLLARLKQPKASWEELYRRMASLSVKPLQELVESTDSMSYEALAEKINICEKKAPNKSYRLSPPIKIEAQFSPIVIESFSSMEKPKEKIGSRASPLACEIPIGSETGVVVHQLLQRFAYDSIELKNVEEALLFTSLSKWSVAVYNLLKNIVETPIWLGDAWVRLNEIDREKQFRELEFLFPTERGFTKGFIDLVFKYRHKYYILDWKSHWLPSYSKEQLQQVVELHSYSMQGKIYTEALKRYLALFDPCPFEQLFGQVLFLFVRGMNSEIPNSGIYLLEREKCLE